MVHRKQISILSLLLTAILLGGCNIGGTQEGPASGAQEAREVETVAAVAATTEMIPTPEPELSPTALEIAATTTSEPTIDPEPSPQKAKSTANADVLHVVAKQTGEDTWHFSVTVAHPDTGWEDFADGWDVVLPDGSVVRPDPDSPFTRLLLHPHETEQPFTRSQSGLVIPLQTASVTVRAHDLVEGFGGREVVLDLQVQNGPDFEVQRISGDSE